MNENPVSPKVWAVIGALASPGLILLVVGALISNDTLVTIGAALLGASPVAGAAGYAKDDQLRVTGRRKRAAKPRARREAGQGVIGVIIVVLVAALVYWLLALLTGSAIVAIVGVVLVLLAAVPAGGYGRW